MGDELDIYLNGNGKNKLLGWGYLRKFAHMSQRCGGLKSAILKVKMCLCRHNGTGGRASMEDKKFDQKKQILKDADIAIKTEKLTIFCTAVRRNRVERTFRLISREGGEIDRRLGDLLNDTITKC